jgi:D-proline reductase (dithiol) PrdB
VGLIQSVIEKAGLPAVSTTVLREITAKVKPPRALFLDRPLGYPLGEPGNADLQKDVIRQALSLASEEVSEMVVREFQASAAAVL